MNERDAFEARFAATVLGYAGRVSSELDPVELAHRIAGREPRRHGLSAAIALRGLTLPARVWAVLLLSALIIGLIAGMLVVGSRPPELPAAVRPAGEPFACPAGTNPDKPGPVDQARPVLAREFESTPLYSTLAAVDSRAGRLVVLADTGQGLQTWTFDLCTNTWTRMRPNQEPPTSEWGQLVYDADSDATILASGFGPVWAYDLPSDTWTSMGARRPPRAPTSVTLWGYDPLTGFVVTGDNTNSGAWNYDVDTNGWTVIPEANGPYVGWPAVYDASVDRIVFPTQAALFDIRTGVWSSTAGEMPPMIAGYGATAPAAVYDARAERTAVIANWRLAAYDATADRWEIVLELPDGGVPLPMAYDPVNKRLIGLGRGTTWLAGDVVALDLVTRQGTVLLAPR